MAPDRNGDIQNADVYLTHKFLHFFSQRILKEDDKNMHKSIWIFHAFCYGRKKLATFQYWVKSNFLFTMCLLLPTMPSPPSKDLPSGFCTRPAIESMGIEKEGGSREGGTQDMKEATNFFRIGPPPINCAFAKCVDPLYVLPLNFGAECEDCFQSYIVSVGGTRVGLVWGVALETFGRGGLSHSWDPPDTPTQCTHSQGKYNQVSRTTRITSIIKLKILQK